MAKGTSHTGGTLLTSAQHEQNRQTAQQRKRARRKGAPNQSASPRDKEAARNARHVQFRRDQANYAFNLLPEELNGLARKVAYAVLEIFPAFDPPKGQDRLEACVATVVEHWLTDAERLRPRAIEVGADTVRDALNGALKKVKKST